jgi:hypothetical protein
MKRDGLTKTLSRSVRRCRTDEQILDEFEEHLNMGSILTDLQEGSNPLTPPQKVLPNPRLRSNVRCLLVKCQVFVGPT